MTTSLTALACAAALCAAGAAQATVINFNDPGLIEIDNNTGVATYTESGYAISGAAASFLLLTNAGSPAFVAGFDTSFTVLKAVGGMPFSLLSLDYAAFDLGAGAQGTLTLVGLFNGAPVVLQALTLGAPASVNFGAGWARLTSVGLTSTGGYSLDNVSVVPEPSRLTLALFGLAAALGVAAGRRRRPS